jgi:hypothetical protein
MSEYTRADVQCTEKNAHGARCTLTMGEDHERGHRWEYNCCPVCGLTAKPCRCDEPIGEVEAECAEKRSVSIEVFMRPCSAYVFITSWRSGEAGFDEPKCTLSVVQHMTRQQCANVAKAVERAWTEYYRRWPA